MVLSSFMLFVCTNIVINFNFLYSCLYNDFIETFPFLFFLVLPTHSMQYVQILLNHNACLKLAWFICQMEAISGQGQQVKMLICINLCCTQEASLLQIVVSIVDSTVLEAQWFCPAGEIWAFQTQAYNTQLYSGILGPEEPFK